MYKVTRIFKISQHSEWTAFAKNLRALLFKEELSIDTNTTFSEIYLAGPLTFLSWLFKIWINNSYFYLGYKEKVKCSSGNETYRSCQKVEAIGKYLRTFFL
jgi:hypothetical protein